LVGGMRAGTGGCASALKTNTKRVHSHFITALIGTLGGNFS
jgi:hypothetical protein